MKENVNERLLLYNISKKQIESPQEQSTEIQDIRTLNNNFETGRAAQHQSSLLPNFKSTQLSIRKLRGFPLGLKNIFKDQWRSL